MNSLEEKIEEVIKVYNNVVLVMDREAKEDETERAYGGIIRAAKGHLQEFITEKLIKIAWEEIGEKEAELKIDSRKHEIPINRNYIKNKIKDKEIREHIERNIENYVYKLSVDKQVYINNKFVLGIECKAYTENAMLKRILVDFHLLKTQFSNISTYLFQLESQLGGDYSELKEKTFGSYSTHTLLSYFEDVELQIITFVKGERKVNKPIHKFFKPIDKNQLLFAIELLKEDLKKHLNHQRTNNKF